MKSYVKSVQSKLSKMEPKAKFQLLSFLLILPLAIFKSIEVALTIFDTSIIILTIVAIIGSFFFTMEKMVEKYLIKKLERLWKGMVFPGGFIKFREFCFQYGVIVLFISIGFNPLNDILNGRIPTINLKTIKELWELSIFLCVIGLYSGYLYMAYSGIVSLMRNDFEENKNLHPFYD